MGGRQGGGGKQLYTPSTGNCSTPHSPRWLMLLMLLLLHKEGLQAGNACGYPLLLRVSCYTLRLLLLQLKLLHLPPAVIPQPLKVIQRNNHLGCWGGFHTTRVTLVL